MSKSNLFKWRHYQTGSILYCGCYYLRYTLSWRHAEELMSKQASSALNACLFYPIVEVGIVLEQAWFPSC